MIMKRNTTLLLSVPVALALASCGMTAQYSYQQYQDGIYSYGGTYVPRKEVTIYSVEDFEAMAAARIAEKQGAARDTVYVVLEDDSDIYLSFGLVPFLLWDSWYLPDPWEYRIWYNHYRWYDPWYYGYSWAFDPWYHHYWHDPWYYGHWYDPWYHGYWHHDPWHVGPRPPKPGLSPDGRRYFGERRFTQSIRIRRLYGSQTFIRRKCHRWRNCSVTQLGSGRRKFREDQVFEQAEQPQHKYWFGHETVAGRRQQYRFGCETRLSEPRQFGALRRNLHPQERQLPFFRLHYCQEEPLDAFVH